MRNVGLLSILLCAGCASHPHLSKRSLSDFDGHLDVYSAYLDEYYAGYVAALHTEARDVDYLPSTTFTSAEEAKIKGWQDGQNDGWVAALKASEPPRKIKGLNGSTEQKLVARFGAPKSVSEFPMSQALSLFRVKLQSHYPLPENGSVAVRELTWELPEVGLLTVWMHQRAGTWRAFESTAYDKWTVF